LTPIADRHKVRSMIKLTLALVAGLVVGAVATTRIVGRRLGEVIAAELEPVDAVRILKALQGSK
jgi:hypothetical protein